MQSIMHVGGLDCLRALAGGASHAHIVENFLRQFEAVVGWRHARVDGALQDDFLDLVFRQPVVESGADVEFEFIPIARRDR